MFWLLAAEILLEQVDLVVLSDAFLGARDQILGGLSEPKLRVPVELLQVLGYVGVLSVVVVLRPTYFKLFITGGCSATYLLRHASCLGCWLQLSRC